MVIALCQHMQEGHHMLMLRYLCRHKFSDFVPADLHGMVCSKLCQNLEQLALEFKIRFTCFFQRR